MIEWMPRGTDSLRMGLHVVLERLVHRRELLLALHTSSTTMTGLARRASSMAASGRRAHAVLPTPGGPEARPG